MLFRFFNQFKTRIFIFLVLCITLSIFWTSHLEPTIHYFGLSETHNATPRIENKKLTEKIKYILLWTKFFESKSWELESGILGKEYFERTKCSITSCIITSERKLLPSIKGYDALMFHAAREWADNPLERSDNQTYVMAINESPPHSEHNLNRDRGFFNRTMTYRLDADILWPYSIVVDIETGEQVAPLPGTSLPNWRMFEYNFTNQTMLNATKKKTKMSAWFVSNCNTLSNREVLIKKMQQHLSVDIYGACGPFRCTKFSNECSNTLDNDYKFYMAFENSLYEDYVTEKLFDNLKRLVIPVVYGGADYRKFAPPMSYINVNDFGTIAELVKYLKYLNAHPEDYIKYFWWKKYYRIEASTPFCDLCKSLHGMDEQRKVYKDPKRWWFGDDYKRAARIKF